MNLEQRGELIIRIKAMEEEAKNKGYEMTFFTVTSSQKTMHQ